MRKPSSATAQRSSTFMQNVDALVEQGLPRQRVERDPDHQREHHGGDGRHAADDGRGGHRHDGDQRREREPRQNSAGLIQSGLGSGMIGCHRKASHHHGCKQGGGMTIQGR